jgi:hypothetical protein
MGLADLIKTVMAAYNSVLFTSLFSLSLFLERDISTWSHSNI